MIPVAAVASLAIPDPEIQRKFPHDRLKQCMETQKKRLHWGADQVKNIADDVAKEENAKKNNFQMFLTESKIPLSVAAGGAMAYLTYRYSPVPAPQTVLIAGAGTAGATYLGITAASCPEGDFMQCLIGDTTKASIDAAADFGLATGGLFISPACKAAAGIGDGLDKAGHFVQEGASAATDYLMQKSKEAGENIEKATRPLRKEIRKQEKAALTSIVGGKTASADLNRLDNSLHKDANDYVKLAARNRDIVLHHPTPKNILEITKQDLHFVGHTRTVAAGKKIASDVAAAAVKKAAEAPVVAEHVVKNAERKAVKFVAKETGKINRGINSLAHQPVHLANQIAHTKPVKKLDHLVKKEISDFTHVLAHPIHFPGPHHRSSSHTHHHAIHLGHRGRKHDAVHVASRGVRRATRSVTSLVGHLFG
jgi:hypothetical protein